MTSQEFNWFLRERKSRETLRRVNPTLKALQIGGPVITGWRQKGSSYLSSDCCILETLTIDRYHHGIASFVDHEEFVDELKCNSSIQELVLIDCDLSQKPVQDVLSAFQENSSLQSISFLQSPGFLQNEYGVFTQEMFNIVASTIIRHPELEEITIRDGINDDYTKILVSIVRGCHKLKKLDLNLNRIARAGCEALAILLRDSRCNLITLDKRIDGLAIDNDCVKILASALETNSKLERLLLDNDPCITSSVWEAFSKILCDTSSINATYNSNHTLKVLGNPIYDPFLMSSRIASLLRLNNEGADKNQIAVKKILHCHHSIDMTPFFEWDMKLLPTAVGWFERAGACSEPDVAGSVGVRKLDAIYQFVLAMPENLEP